MTFSQQENSSPAYPVRSSPLEKVRVARSPYNAAAFYYPRYPRTLAFFLLVWRLDGRQFYAPAGEEAPTPPPASHPDGNVCVRSAEKYLLGFPADIILR